MKVGVTGSTGLVGSALVPLLATHGHEVVGLRRNTESAKDQEGWDPNTGRITVSDTALDALVHLAGENIAGGRWNATRKSRIRDSRVNGTRRLAEFAGGLRRGSG